MIEDFLYLGNQPLANGFVNPSEFDKEYKYQLQVGFDSQTKLVTQTNRVDSGLMFNDEYAYRASVSQTMRDHFQYIANRILPKGIASDANILEIGSNDGVFIKHMDPKNIVAVEPCKNFADITTGMGYTTYNTFWNKNTAKSIIENHGYQNVIYSANCMCHIPDLDDAFEAVAMTLHPAAGMFIFEDPSLAEMINRGSYDQIYDEHVHIFSVTALKNILEKHGLHIVYVENLSVHGGSNRIYAMKFPPADNIKVVQDNLDYEKVLGLDKIDTYHKFSERVIDSKDKLNRILTNLLDVNQQVISYGATSKSTTIFNYCGIGDTLINCVLDTTPEKIGKYTPGTHIPIIDANTGIPDECNYVFLGAWNFANEIRNKEIEFVKRGGKFITHVPTPMFV